MGYIPEKIAFIYKEEDLNDIGVANSYVSDAENEKVIATGKRWAEA